MKFWLVSLTDEGRRVHPVYDHFVEFLVRAPDAEEARAMVEEAHGLMADWKPFPFWRLPQYADCQELLDGPPEIVRGWMHHG